MNIIFYLPKKCINDATSYYSNLIKIAFEQSNFNVIVYEDLNFKYSDKDFFFVIRVRDYFNLFLKTRSFKIIHWHQGIGPEQIMLIHGFSIKSKITAFLLSVVEFFQLRFSYFNFYVSEEMIRHYSRKYFFKIVDFCIIPCYNKNLSKESFETNKIKNSFVYAGSLYHWQCFDKTLETFSLIEKEIEDASLYILTNELEESKRMIKKYGIKNVQTYYVNIDDLDKELSKFQYGFLLREDDIINGVATPTKMNSYLAAGIIPIYTDVVDSFKHNIDLKEFGIKLKNMTEINQIPRLIKENYEIDYKRFFQVCLENFENYYDDEYNIKLAKNTLIKKILSETNKN
jgi:hypothetical protein